MADLNSVSQALRTWEAVPHAELPHFRSPGQTDADLRALLLLLSPDDAILDLGCGWGRITLELAGRGYNVTGVDLSPNLIAYAHRAARAAGVTVRYHVGSMLDLPYPDGSFDKLLCLWGVFSHLLSFQDQVLAVDEMYRVLRPGGIAFVELSNGESKRYRMTRQRQGFGPDKRVFVAQYSEIPNTLYVHDRGTLRDIAAHSAFRRYEVKFKNINRKRRLVMLLHRS
jgi:ubiquinone/menaquinone biosynthesis C-methylase UbiE